MKIRDRKYFNIYEALNTTEVSQLQLRALEYVIDGTHLDHETISLRDIVADLFFGRLEGLDCVSVKEVKDWLKERNCKYL